jgi:hypothetical protein
MMRPGDIFAITTSKGKAYLQFTKQIPPFGSLIRVLPGIYPKQPSDWLALVNQATNFWIFFPLGAAVKRRIVEKTTNCEVPSHAQKIPVFRAGIPERGSPKVANWWLWDGEKEWRVGAITEEQRKLPIRATWNDTMLIERIEEGWLPEKDPS